MSEITSGLNQIALSTECQEKLARLDVKKIDTPFAAIRFIAKGYVPIECAFGSISAVDDLVLDHHGDYSHLEPVALRAYRDLYGVLAENPRIVFTGEADADASLAAAALIGVIPQNAISESIVDLVARLDMAPVGINLKSEPAGAYIRLWQKLVENDASPNQFQRAVHYWALLASLTPDYVQQYAALLEEEIDLSQIVIPQTKGVAMVTELPFSLMSQLYRLKNTEADPALPSSWENPVIVLYDKAKTADGIDTLVVGCANNEVAAALFGEGGLLNVFPKLGAGWGGRNSIGGSPRGVAMQVEQVNVIAEQIGALMPVEG